MTDATDFVPISPAVFHILLALSDRERHGYAIIKEIERRVEVPIALVST